MIGVISQGRMGNQMFQLAFAYCAAQKLKTSYFIFGADSLHYFHCHESLLKFNRRNTQLFALRNLMASSQHVFHYTGRKSILPQLSRKAVFKNVMTWPNKVGEQNFQLLNYSDNTLYAGFFQSEAYFMEFSSQIKDIFRLNDDVKNVYARRQKPYMKGDYVAVHLRRSDYLQYGGDELGGIDMTLPSTYYHRCLSIIEGKQNIPVVFVSDDIEFVKSEFGTKENFYFESNDEITDFQILLHASVVVTANSTFSWWAAWLNEKSNKVVYAPDYFLGFKIKEDYPGGIRVKEWNWINVGGQYE